MIFKIIIIYKKKPKGVIYFKSIEIGDVRYEVSEVELNDCIFTSKLKIDSNKIELKDILYTLQTLFDLVNVKKLEVVEC